MSCAIRVARSRVALLALPLMVTAAGLPAAAESPAADSSDLIATLLPEAVAITAVQHIPSAASESGAPADPDAYTRKESYGSGFVYDPSGLIVTNRHVIANASEIYVTLDDNTKLKATLIYQAPIDMALLKVDAGRPLQPVKWADSSTLRPGDEVIAIGNPFGIGETVTTGIVSALDRDIGQTQDINGGGENLDAFIQTDAALNRGNSGGPLFNLKGEVIGIDTSIVSPTASSAGLGFAIPSNDALFVLDQYGKYGRVRAGYLGTTVQQMDPAIADSAGLSSPRGVIINNVLSGSPAAQAGLRTGDVILKIGDREIRDPRTFNRAVAATPFGQTTQVEIWRDAHDEVVNVTFSEAPSSEPVVTQVHAEPPSPAQLNAADLGFELAPLDDSLRKKFNLAPERQGVVVTAVKPNSFADLRGAVPGDIVVKVQDTPVTSPADLSAAVRAARAANQRHLLVMIERGQQFRWLGVPLVASTAQ
jgi:serine protease Do